MMYRKALLFSDTDIASRILREPSPKKQKALGRKVRNFDRKIWDEHKEAIVEEGNWWKFTAAKEDSNSRPGKKDPLVGVKGLAERLLGTGERELVEVCPLFLDFFNYPVSHDSFPISRFPDMVWCLTSQCHHLTISG